MKMLTLIAITLALFSTNSIAKKFYADVQLTHISPPSNAIWQRENKNTPRYPIALARSGLKGCSVLSFTISEKGEAENIEVISSVPNKHIGRHSRKLINNWKWLPTPETTKPASEERVLRLDFCMGGESIEQSQSACKQQTRLVCG
ncbi:energy transducer TonB [Thalassotalea sp. 1_MG-2023]|uniref:energy transducer TonB n=1 Tax=Thalassotalea sp. 1_MG-2023 TaxID=3062680 RepID=UPI0026E1C6E9|nr:energy transducer TonB [Thalassotalea sp. 1_MG-2023]MDO6426975.1 energy transducer TonB [Thalassotalea sp. 1_MG-2023]